MNAGRPEAGLPFWNKLKNSKHLHRVLYLHKSKFDEKNTESGYWVCMTAPS